MNLEQEGGTHTICRCENRTAETKMKTCHSEQDPAAMLVLLAGCTLVLMESGSEVTAGKPDPRFSAWQVFLIYTAVCPVK